MRSIRQSLVSSPTWEWSLEARALLRPLADSRQAWLCFGGSAARLKSRVPLATFRAGKIFPGRVARSAEGRRIPAHRERMTSLAPARSVHPNAAIAERGAAGQHAAAPRAT